MKVTVKQTNLNNCIHNRGEKLVQWINNLHELESLSSTIRFVSVCVDNAKNHSRLIDKIWNDFITFDWNVCPIIQLNGVRVFCVCLFFSFYFNKCNGKFWVYQSHYWIHPRKFGSSVPAAYGSSVLGSVARYSSARWIASGIGGGVGRWSPCGWKPFSSAIYVTVYKTPSGPV